jgi:hypothetical protein
MKKIVLFLAVAGVLAACEKEGDCRTHTLVPELKIQRSEFTVNDVTVKPGNVVSSSEIRLKLFSEFVYLLPATDANMERDKACSHRSYYPYTPVYGISITCDKPIANIEAGKDLIEIMNPQIHIKGHGDFSVSEWIDSYNRGHFLSGLGGALEGMLYELDIAFLPYYVSVAEGNYSFTLIITTGYYGSEKILYSRTFPSVHLK